MIIYEIDLDTSKRKQNGHHFSDNIFKCNLPYKNLCVLIHILLKRVRRDPVHKASVVQAMAWRRASAKPLP